MSAERETVLVVDDDPQFRKTIWELLSHAGFLVELAGDADAALSMTARHAPDIVLLDVKLPRVSGYELLRRLQDRFGAELPIIFISGERTDPYDRVAGLLLGAEDYILKPFDPDELIARIRRSLRPAPAHSEGTRDDSAADAALGSLTSREREVLILLAEGKDSNEIADVLMISPRTLGTHVQHILTKLDVHNRAQAVAAAHRAGLVDEVGGHAAASQ